MRVITWIHILYVGLFSVLTLFTSTVGLYQGIAHPSTTTDINKLLHIVLGCIGIVAVVLHAKRKKHALAWLLVVWWLPQLFKVTIATRMPTYPQNMMTPVYVLTACLSVSISIIRELSVDRLLLVQFNILAIIGLFLAIFAVSQRSLKVMPDNAEPIPSTDIANCTPEEDHCQ